MSPEQVTLKPAVYVVSCGTLHAIVKEFVYSRSIKEFTRTRSEMSEHSRIELLVFEERGKPEYPEKNLLEQSREPTTNSTDIIDTGSGNRTRDTLMEGGHSHHCTIPAPRLHHPCSLDSHRCFYVLFF